MCSERMNKSRDEGCAGIQPGVPAFGFLPNVKGGLTLASDERWEGAGLTGSIYRWVVDNEVSTWEETGETNNDTQASSITGTITIQLPHLDQATRDQINLMRQDKPHVFVELHNGNILLIGAKRGCRVNFAASAGAASADLQGYTLTITSRENKMFSYLGATGSTMYNAALSTDSIKPQR